jgi:Zn-dependent protease
MVCIVDVDPGLWGDFVPGVDGPPRLPAPWVGPAGPGTDIDEIAMPSTSDEVKSAAKKATPIALLGAKLLTALKASKATLLMLTSLVIYVKIFGWEFAVGFMVLLWIHEMGHVLALRRLGIAASKPMFIPLFGAFIRMKGVPKRAWDESMVGIAGPVFGTAASIAVLGLWKLSGSRELEAIAYIGFFLNAFNLIPMLPLDGGRVTQGLHPAAMFAGLAVLGVTIFLFPNPILIVMGILGLIEVINRTRRWRSVGLGAYHDMTASERFSIAAMYLGLLAILGCGLWATYLPSHNGHP